MMKFIAACVLATITFAAAPPALKAADPDALCPRQNATLVGTYMSHGAGTVVGVGPVSAVGTITYDGQGNLINPFTISLNGAVSRLTQAGSYTVNRDCTGTVVQGGAHYDFVVAPDASTLFWMETDAGTIVTGTAVRMKSTDAQDAERASGLNKDTARVPLGGTASPESLAAVVSAPQNRGGGGAPRVRLS
jgi:hypothetical protein